MASNQCHKAFAKFILEKMLNFSSRAVTAVLQHSMNDHPGEKLPQPCCNPTMGRHYIRLAKACVSDLRSLPSESILVAG